LPSGTTITPDVQVTVVPTSLGGQTNYVSYKFTGNLVLQPGQMIQIQSRFNKNDWSNMLQDNDWSYTNTSSFIQWNKITGYQGGTLVWGQEPVSKASALTVASVLAFPNPSTGNGTNLVINLSGSTSNANVISTQTQMVDPNAQVTVKVYTLAFRMIWFQTVTGTSFGTSGNHTLYWDEKDSSGANLANGLYYVRATVKSNGSTSTKTSPILIMK